MANAVATKGRIRPAFERIAELLGLVVPLAVILAFAILIPLGQWREDEYDTFARIRDGGLPFVWARITGWSPRPLSEFLLYVYGNAVDLTGMRLITPFLGLLWVLLLAACVVPAIKLRERSSPAFTSALTLCLATAALFLSGHRVDEVFFWTQGSVAYMPTLAAVSFIVGVHVFRESASTPLRVATSLSAVLAALSSEMGATFSVAYGAGMLVAEPAYRMLGGRRPLLRRTDFEFFVPLIAGLSILAMVSRGRLGVSYEAVGDPAIVHQLVPSFLATLKALPIEVLSLGSGASSPERLVLGSLILVLFAFGAFAIFRQLGLAGDFSFRLRTLVVGVAVLSAAFLSLFGGYHQFGLACCGRHETMRECLAFVSVLAFARLAADLIPRSDRLSTAVRSILPPLMLSAAVLLSNAKTFGPMSRDYRRFAEIRMASLDNWNSGRADQNRMTYRPVYGETICWASHWARGTYSVEGEIPANVRFMATYFQKIDVVVTKDSSPCPPS